MGSTPTPLLSRWQLQKTNQTSNLTCFCQNVGGLHTRLKDFREAVSLCNYTAKKVHFPGYQVYHKHQDVDLWNKNISGGILIALSQELVCRMISAPTNGVEELFIELKCAKETIIIEDVYIPPKDFWNEDFHAINNPLCSIN